MRHPVFLSAMQSVAAVSKVTERAAAAWPRGMRVAAIGDH